MSETKQIVIDRLEEFFEENNYKEMTVKWKEQTFNRLDIFSKLLLGNRNMEIEDLFKKRKVNILVVGC